MMLHWKSTTDTSQADFLPGECILDKINLRCLAPVSDSLPYVIAQTACSTDRDSHGANLFVLLLCYQSTNIRLAGVHLHARTWRMDLLDTARSSNEEKYLEYIATFLHAEDLGLSLIHI